MSFGFYHMIYLLKWSNKKSTLCYWRVIVIETWQALSNFAKFFKEVNWKLCHTLYSLTPVLLLYPSVIIASIPSRSIIKAFIINLTLHSSLLQHQSPKKPLRILGSSQYPNSVQIISLPLGYNFVICEATRLRETESTAFRGGPRTVATSKIERFVIIVNGWKLLSRSAPSWMLQQS